MFDTGPHYVIRLAFHSLCWPRTGSNPVLDSGVTGITDTHHDVNLKPGTSVNVWLIAVNPGMGALQCLPHVTLMIILVYCHFRENETGAEEM